ncbi:MAG: heavy-metal-associated domain-containing protein [Gammaproteobacteria bacterium]|nr:heavy-metal-associated domain-containing protein [Gammaproteobacteria bacterium]
MSKTIQLSIPGMMCGGCLSTVQKVFDNEAGVANTAIDLAAKTASVEADVPPAVLIAALKSAGFEATQIGNGQNGEPAA